MRFDEIRNEIENIILVGKGWRGIVYKGKYKNKDLAFKVALEPQFVPNIQKEGKILKIVNQENIGGKIVISGEDFIAYEFIKGVPLKEVISEDNGEIIIYQLLKQARILDRLGINKEEMHRPYKNVLVDKDLNVFLIDFERAKFGKNIQNVTQLLQFIMSEGKKYLKPYHKKTLVELAKIYKKNKSEENFRRILEFLKLKD